MRRQVIGQRTTAVVLGSSSKSGLAADGSKTKECVLSERPREGAKMKSSDIKQGGSALRGPEGDGGLCRK